MRGFRAPLLIAVVALGLAGCSHVSRPPAVLQPVWVNTASGIYHHAGSVWYGSTEHGKYMSEVDAIKAHYRKAKNEK